MAYRFSMRSKMRLKNAHPDLQRVFNRAISMTHIDFTVLETTRTIEQQRAYVAKGASKTMRSRHLPSSDGKSRAIDVAPYIDGKVSWAWPLYHQLAKVIKEAARIEDVTIEWGGDWRSFKDGPHWQLPWSTHP